MDDKPGYPGSSRRGNGDAVGANGTSRRAPYPHQHLVEEHIRSKDRDRTTDRDRERAGDRRRDGDNDRSRDRRGAGTNDKTGDRC